MLRGDMTGTDLCAHKVYIERLIYYLKTIGTGLGIRKGYVERIVLRKDMTGTGLCPQKVYNERFTSYWNRTGIGVPKENGM